MNDINDGIDDGDEVSDLQVRRLKNIERNRQRLANIGITHPIGEAPSPIVQVHSSSNVKINNISVSSLRTDTISRVSTHLQPEIVKNNHNSNVDNSDSSIPFLPRRSTRRAVPPVDPVHKHSYVKKSSIHRRRDHPEPSGSKPSNVTMERSREKNASVRGLSSSTSLSPSSSSNRNCDVSKLVVGCACSNGISKLKVMESIGGRGIRFSLMAGLQPFKNAIVLFVNAPLDKDKPASASSSTPLSTYPNSLRSVGQDGLAISWFAPGNFSPETPSMMKIRTNSCPIFFFCREPGNPYVYCGQVLFVDSLPQ